MDNGASSYRRFLDGDENGIVEIIRDYKDGLIFYLNEFTQNIYVAEELAEELKSIILPVYQSAQNCGFGRWKY